MSGNRVGLEVQDISGDEPLSVADGDQPVDAADEQAVTIAASGSWQTLNRPPLDSLR